MRQKDKNKTAIKNSVIILYKLLIHNMKKIDLNAIQKGNKKENTLFTRVSNSKKKQVEAVASELGINTSQFVRASIDNFLIQLS